MRQGLIGDSVWGDFLMWYYISYSDNKKINYSSMRKERFDPQKVFNPEERIPLAREEENATFEERKEKIRDGKGVEQIIQDIGLVDDIRGGGYPEDEEVCEEIAKRHGVDPAMVAVIAEKLLPYDKTREGTH